MSTGDCTSLCCALDAAEAELSELRARVARVIDYIENVGLVGVSWAAEDSERTLLAILEGDEK